MVTERTRTVRASRLSRAARIGNLRRSCTVLMWSQERFGERATARYQELLKQGLRDIADDPARAGSGDRPELAPGIRTHHLYFSRGRLAPPWGLVRAPGHILVYRRRGDEVVDVVRVLHDAREMERHLPAGSRRYTEASGPGEP